LRSKNAEVIATQVSTELQALNLPHSRLDIQIHQHPDEHGISIKDQMVKLFSEGIDDVTFQFSANPDTPPGNLNQIASGGELSRVMLALKAGFLTSGSPQSIIFDEIDTGISGKTAQQVAKKIKSLSRQYQVICVTHLATIAAQGDSHILVEKQSDGQHTEISTKVLAQNGREQEISRLLGAHESEASLQHARELLAGA